MTSPRETVLCFDNLDHFLFGTSLLAAGGGGDPYIGRLLLRQAMKKHGPARLVDPGDVADEDLVLVVGAVGAATVFLERFPSLSALARAVAAIEQYLGRKVDAFAGAEAGGLNAALPIALGLTLGRPVVDADGMGRAFPRSEMMTYGIYGGSASPMALASETNDAVIIDAASNIEAENLCRLIVDHMGNTAMAAIYPMRGDFFKSAAVRNSAGLALEIGAAVAEARARKDKPLEALTSYFNESHRPTRFARILARGAITDLASRTGGGFVRGAVRIESGDGDVCSVEFQNENLVALVNGRAAAMVPDIITILDEETSDPITTENLSFGQRVCVFALAAPDMLRTPKAVKVVGPRAFGYAFDYQPLEDLHAAPRSIRGRL